jgi:Protein of unknown function (DUF3341)
MRGVLAAFPTEAALERAVSRLGGDGIPSETYTPHPRRTDPPRSWVPLAVLVVGACGTACVFGLQVYATMQNYPFDIGGRPYFSWPAYVPMAFEFGVLFAVLAGFFGFLLACRLPRLYDPIDEVDAFRAASRDAFFVAVSSTDPRHLARALDILGELQPSFVAELPP